MASVDESVSTKEKGSITLFPTLATTRRVCHVCQKQFSNYTCPRCTSRYCSLKCYKSHSLRCTESFMRENVVEEMGKMQPDDETKQKMIDILKRFHSEEGAESMDGDEGDCSPCALSEETIEKILSGRQFSLDDLSGKEMKLFHRAMASGELSKMIEPWEPWWLKPSARRIFLSKQGTRLVKPVHQDDHRECDQSGGVPPGPETPLPSVNKLTSANPSPLLAVHLVDLMYSYCFTLRLYNGDWQSDALGAATVVMNISDVLGECGQPESVSTALAYCLQKTCSADYKHTGGLQFGMGLFDDIVSLLNLGGPAIVCFLCDLHRLIQGAEEELQLEKQRKVKSQSKSKLKLANRKVYFLMCWVHEQPNEAWHSLQTLVNVEKKCIAEMDQGEQRKPVQVYSKESQGKRLIEEIK